MYMLKTIVSNKIIKLKHSKSLKNGALFSMFSFINRGFSFFLLLILANYMPPAEYGYLGLFQTVIMLMGYFIALQTEGYLSVSYFNDDLIGFRNTLSCIYYTAIIMTWLFCLVVLIGGSKLGEVLSLPLGMLILAIPICFFTVFVNINLDYYRLQEKVKTYGILSCGNALLNFLLSIIFVKYLTLGWEGRVWAQFSCCAAFGVFGFLFFLRKKMVGVPTWRHWRSILIWSIPLIPHMATNFIKQGCDRYIINVYHSIDDVGLFTFALNLANIIIMIGVGFNQSDSVEVYKILGNKEMSSNEMMILLSRRRHLLARFYAMCTFVIVSLGYFLFPVFLPRYEAAMNYFILLGLFGFLNCLYFLYTNYLFFFKKTKQIMYCTFGTSILHLLQSLLITRYSLYCTCIVYCISMGAMVFLIRHYALKEIKNKI